MQLQALVTFLLAKVKVNPYLTSPWVKKGKIGKV